MDRYPATCCPAARTLTTLLVAALLGACTAGPELAGPSLLNPIVLTQNALDLVPAATWQLSGVVRDQNGSAVPASSLAWSSSDERVATVNAAGAVLAIAAGSATITANYRGLTASVPVVVHEGGVVLPGGSVVDAQRGNISMSIPKGAVSAALSMVVEPVSTPPGDARIVPGTVYSFSPSDASFLTAATLNISYDASLVPASSPTGQFKIYRLVNDRWMLVGGTTTVNGGIRTVSVKIGSLGTYAVFAPASE